MTLKNHRKRKSSIDSIRSNAILNYQSFEPPEPTPGFLWRTMLHITTLPNKFTDAMSVLMRYAHQSVTILFCPM
jgi:hypothetical protein